MIAKNSFYSLSFLIEMRLLKKQCDFILISPFWFMAKQTKAKSQRPEIQKLADEIIKEQTKEIADLGSVSHLLEKNNKHRL